MPLVLISVVWLRSILVFVLCFNFFVCLKSFVLNEVHCLHSGLLYCLQDAFGWFMLSNKKNRGLGECSAYTVSPVFFRHFSCALVQLYIVHVRRASKFWFPLLQSTVVPCFRRRTAKNRAYREPARITVTLGLGACGE